MSIGLPKGDRQTIQLILLVCLALRLLFFLAAQPWESAVEERAVLRADALGYHRLASTLNECGRFAQGCAEPLESIRTPLYPAFVAGIYRLCGPRPWIVMLVQMGLELVTCWLLWLTLATVLERRVGLVAALLYAIDPFLVLYTSALLSETLFLTLLLAVLWSIVAAGRAKTIRTVALLAALAGLAAGLATLARPVCQIIPIFLLIHLLFSLRRLPRRGAAGALALVVMFSLVVSPWVWRNQRTFGQASLSSVGAFVLVLHVAPMEATLRGQEIGVVKQALVTEAEEMLRADGHDPATVDPFVKAHYWRGLARRYITDKPLSFALSTARGIVHAGGNLATSDFARMLGAEPRALPLKGEAGLVALARRFVQEKGALQLGIALGILSFLLASYAGLAVGLVTAWRSRERAVLALCLTLAAYFIVVTGAAGLARYRLPAVPFYLPFIAIGWITIADLVRRRRGRRKRS